MRFLFLLLSLNFFINCSGNKTLNNQLSKLSNLPVPARIEALINTTDPAINIGIKIISLTDNRVIYERNADRYFTPASTIKLATVAAALYYLGPSYRFNTNIHADNFDTSTGAIKNLYLEGSGDPSLMDHDLIHLAHELKQQKIKTISGNIYIDDQVFDTTFWTKGAMWDDRKFGYNAPVSGLNLNYNRLQIKTMASHKINNPASVVATPACGYIKVSSKAITKNEKATNNLNLSILQNNQEKAWANINHDGLSSGDHVFVNGHIAKNSSPNYFLLSIKDPGMLAGCFLREQLMREGITFSGKILRKKTPTQAIRLASHQSRALSEALIDFTKISNNVATDSLVKAIAAQAGQKPASFAGGLKLINDFLTKQVGIPEGAIVNADGAGVSRYNLITPSQMVKLLHYAANHFSSGPEFMAAMPLAGQDGTLGARLKAPHLAGNIRAKTGSLTGVSGLAGYFIGEHNKRYAFAIFINGFTGSLTKYKNLQDDILANILPQRDLPVESARAE